VPDYFEFSFCPEITKTVAASNHWFGPGFNPCSWKKAVISETPFVPPMILKLQFEGKTPAFFVF